MDEKEYMRLIKDQNVKEIENKVYKKENAYFFIDSGLKELKKLAEKDNTYAQIALAEMYYCEGGREIDAFEYYFRASCLGNTYAMYYLAINYWDATCSIKLIFLDTCLL